MKYFTLVLALLFGLPAVADNLVWDDPNPPEKVNGYRIWKEVDLGVWEEVATVSENKWKITLPAGVHRLSVSAVGAGAESVSSALSDPVTLTVLVVPANVRIEK